MPSTSPWSGHLHMDRSWAAFRGASSTNTLHAHVAMQLCVGHGNLPSIVAANGQSVRSRGVAIRPGILHRLEPSADVTLVFVEPQTPLAQALLDMLQAGPIVPISDALCDRIAAGVVLSDVLAGFAAGTGREATLDERVRTALMRLVDTHASNAIAQTAQHVGLSPSRLRALTREQLGVSLVSWVMWRKLERSGVAIMAGTGLAEAAVAGGFADQAHFSRAMRRVFGITPGELADLAKGQTLQANRTRRPARLG